MCNVVFSLCWLLTLLYHVSNQLEVFPLMFPPSLLDLYCCFHAHQAGQGPPLTAPHPSLHSPPDRFQEVLDLDNP
jgi:hypothetical protein